MSLRIRSDRLKDIMWGYAAAVLAASAAIALSIAAMTLMSSSGSAKPLMMQLGNGLALAAFISIYALPFTFLLALLPATAVVVYAEPRGVRSPIAYALLGVLVAVASFVWATVLFDWITYQPSRPARITPIAEMIRPLAIGALLFVIPGLCGGLTYWAKAGRNAGD
jgi:hypothetical protein